MANENDIGGRVGLDTTDFKAAVSDLNRQIRVIESGFKAVAAGMDDWRTTSDGLQNRIESLSKVTDLQRQKVSNLKSEYDKVVEAKGRDSKAAQDLEVRINKESAALNKNELELKQCRNSLEDLDKGSNKAEKDVKELGDEMERSAKKSGTLKDALKGLGSHLGSGIATAAKITATAVIGIGLAASAASVGIFKLAEKASDLGEAQNVVQQTFKASNKAIVDWTNTTASAAGISKTMATQWVGSMGAMLKSSGLTEDAAGNMGKSLVQLAGDMSSFYNLDSQTAWDKLRSGIAGETEPLKQLGINMSVANLEAFALSQGINKAYKEMSQAEQTTLRYNYLMSVTKDAQGDFARTLGDSFANQIRVAKMNLETLGQSIGSIFLPSILNATKSLNSAFGEINNVLADGFQDSDLDKIASILTDILQKAVSSFAKFIPKMVPLIVSSLNTIISAIVKVLPTLLPDLLNGAIQLLTGLISLIQQNVQPLADLAVNLLTQFANFILTALPQLIVAAIQIIVALVNGIAQSLPQLIPVAIQAIMTIVNAIIDNLPQLLNAAVQIIFALVDGILELLPELIPAAIQLLVVLSQGIVDNLPKLIEKLPIIVQTIVDVIVDNLPLLIDAAIKIILALVEAIIKNLPMIIQASFKIMTALAGGLLDAIGELWQVIPKLFTAVKEKFSEMDWAKLGIDIINGIISGITSMAGTLADSFADAIGGAVDGVKDMLGIHSPSRVMRDQVGKNISLGVAEGITGTTREVDAAMSNLTGRLTSKIGTELNVNNSAQSNDNSGIIDVLKDLANALSEYRPTLNIDSEKVAIATGPFDNRIQGQNLAWALMSGGL
jgi:phage-related protein